MVPTLRPGDRLLVLYGGTARPGWLVVARYRSLPGQLVVKRAVRAVDGGWELASDNPFAPTPQGIADVEGRVLLRYWPRPRLR
jgi:phage repressor protein C with HTH and peptisase S24 domain